MQLAGDLPGIICLPFLYACALHSPVWSRGRSPCGLSFFMLDPAHAASALDSGAAVL